MFFTKRSQPSKLSSALLPVTQWELEDKRKESHDKLRKEMGNLDNWVITADLYTSAEDSLVCTHKTKPIVLRIALDEPYVGESEWLTVLVNNQSRELDSPEDLAVSIFSLRQHYLNGLSNEKNAEDYHWYNELTSNL